METRTLIQPSAWRGRCALYGVGADLCIVEGWGVVAMVSDTMQAGSCVYYAGKRDSHTSHKCVLTLL